MNWVLVIYMGFVAGYIKMEYPTKQECYQAAKEWREMNPESDAVLTCVAQEGE